MSNTQPTSRPKSGFTLVELLVVITIIGILVALLLPAIGAVKKNALKTRISGDIHGVAEAIEIFKNEVSGGAYPPDVIYGGTSATQSAAVNDFKRFFNKCFPRHREPNSLIVALAGANTGGSPADEGNPNLPGGISPAEAAVFWRQRFSSDERYPISGEGGPSFREGDLEDLASRNWISRPDDARLGPRDANGAFDTSTQRQLHYQVDTGTGVQERVINFWQHFPSGSEEPVVYFDASRGVRDINHSALAGQLGGSVFSIKQLKSGAPNAEIGNIRLANEGKFQVYHAGVDGAWGDFTAACYIDPSLSATDTVSTLLVYPDGPFNGDIADTVANFAENVTLENSQP